MTPESLEYEINESSDGFWRMHELRIHKEMAHLNATAYEALEMSARSEATIAMRRALVAEYHEDIEEMKSQRANQDNLCRLATAYRVTKKKAIRDERRFFTQMMAIPPHEIWSKNAIEKFKKTFGNAFETAEKLIRMIVSIDMEMKFFNRQNKEGEKIIARLEAQRKTLMTNLKGLLTSKT